MHHVVLDHWSQQSSPLHARDPRFKSVVALGFLVALATTAPITGWAAAGYLGIVLSGILIARLPLTGLLARACVVLPFSGTVAVVSLLSGDTERGIEILFKSYVSALVVLLLIASTPLPRLLGGWQRMGAPAMFVFIIQLVYRYLFVISEQTQHMLTAARCRGGRSHRRSRVRALVGALAVIFGRSHEQAEAVHRAMLARGFQSRLVLLRPMSWNGTDIVFLLASGCAILLVRIPWRHPF